MRLSFSLASMLASLALAACAAPTDDAPQADPQDTSGEDLKGLVPLKPGLSLWYPPEIGAAASGNSEGACYTAPRGLTNDASFPLKQHLTSVKHQAARGTCWAFAITAAAEMLESMKSGRRLDLSEQDLVATVKLRAGDHLGDGANVYESLGRLIEGGYTFPYESEWTYNPSWSRVTTGPSQGPFFNSCVNYTGRTCSDTAHQGRWYGYPFGGGFYSDDAPRSSAVSIKGRTHWGSGDVAVVKGLLAGSLPVIASFATEAMFKNTPSSGFVDPSFLGYFAPAKSAHAIVLIGYVPNEVVPAGYPKSAGNGYFIFKNSWGGSWGDAGYGYVADTWIQQRALSFDTLSL